MHRQVVFHLGRHYLRQSHCSLSLLLHSTLLLALIFLFTFFFGLLLLLFCVQVLHLLPTQTIWHFLYILSNRIYSYSIDLVVIFEYRWHLVPNNISPASFVIHRKIVHIQHGYFKCCFTINFLNLDECLHFWLPFCWWLREVSISFIFIGSDCVDLHFTNPQSHSHSHRFNHSCQMSANYPHDFCS